MDIIETHSVTKNYRVGVGRARVREMVPPPFDRGLAKVFPNWWFKDTFNALEDVCLSIPSSSSVGLVGHNGAGKTTLLKVLAGVTAPTTGTVQTRGRIAGLIDAVVGFHPELTGKENISFLGSMHGFKRRDMAAKVQSISEFAEIDEMLDTPVKRYSAGMSARLGFATIAALEPEILLIDEILAVGDANFQQRCARWLDEYRTQGGTLLFVSHNLSLMRSMTQKVVWLDHGKVVQEGPTATVLAEYGRAMERRSSDAAVGGKNQRATKKLMKATGMNRWGAGGARIQEVHVGEPTNDSLTVTINYEASNIEQGYFCLGFVGEGDNEVGAAVSDSVMLREGGGTIQCEIDSLGLRSGIYFPVAAIISTDGTVQDRWRLDRAVVIERDQNLLPDGFGPVEISSEWSGGKGDQVEMPRLRSVE